MTMESLVIGRHHRPVNMSLLLAHTARQTTEQGLGEASLFWASESKLSEMG
jgi:hypothetical protein